MNDIGFRERYQALLSEHRVTDRQTIVDKFRGDKSEITAKSTKIFGG